MPPRQYPPIYEKLIPILLIILAVGVVILLIGIAAVALFSGVK